MGILVLYNPANYLALAIDFLCRGSTCAPRPYTQPNCVGRGPDFIASFNKQPTPRPQPTKSCQNDRSNQVTCMRSFMLTIHISYFELLPGVLNENPSPLPGEGPLRLWPMLLVSPAKNV